MQELHLLALLCSTLLSGPAAAQVVFQTVRMRNISTPAAMESVPGLNRLKCGELCTLRPNCFGFTWQQSLCRLFNFDAFYNEAWQSCSDCDVYTIKNDAVKLSFIGCNQSSVQMNGICQRALDGNKNQLYSHGSCMHTLDTEAGGWWEGHLPRAMQISHVTIYNRMDCCSSRQNRLSLQVDGVECKRVDVAVPFSVATFRCNAFGSRFRIVRALGTSLTMCEVEIYGL